MAHHLPDLARLPRTELEHLLRYGETPDFASLDGWVFKGANLLAPGRWLFPKFAKGFFTETKDGASLSMGYNAPCARGSLDAPWQLQPSAENFKRFGFYLVRKLRLGERDAKYPNALFLDYGKGGNGLAPERGLRDFLVQVEPNNPDLYLGKAYYSVGLAWVDAGFFALERLQKGPAKAR